MTAKIDLTHLDALNLRLSHERSYLARAKFSGEIELRSVWIRQIEREIEVECRLLGIDACHANAASDEELLSELFS